MILEHTVHVCTYIYTNEDLFHLSHFCTAVDSLSSTVTSELWKDVSEEVSRVLNVDVRTRENEKGKGKKRTGMYVCSVCMTCVSGQLCKSTYYICPNQIWMYVSTMFLLHSNQNR